MSFSFPFSFTKEFFLAQDAPNVLAFLKNYQEALPPFFPGLHRFEQQGPHVYLWEFEPLRYGGKQLTISFTTRFDESDTNIRIYPHSSTSETQLKGEWSVNSTPDGCKLKMHFELEFSVPLPKLMKAMVVPLASTELSKLFERYAENLQHHFS
jgi:ribosome-associated toxin RatA of RatAB toxin-antitoxin module